MIVKEMQRLSSHVCCSVCCSVLQRVAVSCRVLQCVAVSEMTVITQAVTIVKEMQLQFVAVSCSELQ